MRMKAVRASSTHRTNGKTWVIMANPGEGSTCLLTLPAALGIGVAALVTIKRANSSKHSSPLPDPILLKSRNVGTLKQYAATSSHLLLSRAAIYLTKGCSIPCHLNVC